MNRKRKTKQTAIDEKTVSAGRHENRCTICAHEQRADIEAAFVNWNSPSSLKEIYGVSRDSIYRHAHAFGLMDQRRRNIRAALERIIERSGDVEVNAAAVVAAVGVYARINSRGHLVERLETVSLDALFERMTLDELETYAKEGELPEWFDASATARKRNGDERA